AVEIDGALLRQRRDMALLVGHGMRSELGDDLTWTRRMNETLRTLHDLVHRFRRGDAGKDEIGLLADVSRRFRRRSADLLEICQRAATEAHHAMAALDEIFTDRQPDFSDTNEPDGFHASSPVQRFKDRQTRLRHRRAVLTSAAPSRRGRSGCRSWPRAAR